MLDEPKSGLDPTGVADVHDVLRGLAGDGTAVLISSHEMSEVAALCGSVTVLARGKVRYDGPLADLRPEQRGAVFRLTTSDDISALGVARRTSGVHAVAVHDGLELLAQEEAIDALATAACLREPPTPSQPQAPFPPTSSSGADHAPDSRIAPTSCCGGGSATGLPPSGRRLLGGRCRS